METRKFRELLSSVKEGKQYLSERLDKKQLSVIEMRMGTLSKCSIQSVTKLSEKTDRNITIK